MSEERVNELMELVERKRLELGDGRRPLSLERVAARSHGKLNKETLRQIASGTHSGRISDDTAEGLSRALDIPLQTVYDLARIPRPQTRWNWPARFDRLDVPQRRLVEEVAGALLDAYEKGLRDA